MKADVNNVIMNSDHYTTYQQEEEKINTKRRTRSEYNETLRYKDIPVYTERKDKRT